MSQRRRDREAREWEITLALIALMILTTLWEAIGVWYR